MADRRMTVGGEAGTTLAELLVVMLLLGVVGSITTVGVVRGFGAQLTATSVAETLDGTRIATQRVRDFVRGATEVCATSTDTSLVLWTDDDNDGGVVETELDIFELVEDSATGDDVFRRRTPTATGDVTQLIRDDIINAALFEYDTPPADQPDDLACMLDGSTSNGTNRTRVVNVQFEVASPDSNSSDNLTTQTSVRLRNAALVESSANVAPTAGFSVACVTDDLRCTFDAEETSDPDGSIESYTWAYDDPDNPGTAVAMDCEGSNEPLDEVCTFQFPDDRDYEVTLTATDAFTATGTKTRTATPVDEGGAIPPTASFTFKCTGLICDFDASGSSDDDPSTLTYEWDFADNGATATGETAQHNFSKEGEYGVTLTVTDAANLDDSETHTVTASNNTIFVSSLTGTSGGSGSNRFGEFTAQLSLTVGGNPGAGLTITITVEDDKGGTHELSCTTDSTGSCLDAVTGLQENRFPLVATVESVTNTGEYLYDEDQNTDDTETVP